MDVRYVHMETALRSNRFTQRVGQVERVTEHLCRSGMYQAAVRSTHLKRPTLLTYAEVGEDLPEQVLGGDGAGDGA